MFNIVRRFSTRANHYWIRTVGKQGTPDYSVYLQKGEKEAPISFFHDIPLQPENAPNNVFNMVVEVPRWSNAKLEVSKKLSLNPIVQDTKKGKLRYVSNVFPFSGYIHNYGAIPQTWEDPCYEDENTKLKGDDDPVDVCDIGQKIGFTGQIKQVKVLGALAMLDEGETDWKIIAIDNADPLADKMDDIDDVEKHMPGLLDATRSWFRNYKIPDGKPANEFAFDGQFKNKQFALDIIGSTNAHWRQLINGGDAEHQGGISLTNRTLVNSPQYNPDAGSEVPQGTIEPAQSNEEPSDLEKWHFIKQ